MTIPLILVAGFSQTARHRVIREALLEESRATEESRTSPPAQFAWLAHQDSGVGDDAHLDPQMQRQPNQSFVACVCCSGSLVFTTHLARLLRQGAWAGMVISLGARAEPVRMLKLLRAAPWSDRLGPIRLFSVMDEVVLSRH